MKEIRCSYYKEGTFHLMEKKGQQYLAEDGKLSMTLVSGDPLVYLQQVGDTLTYGEPEE